MAPTCSTARLKSTFYPPDCASRGNNHRSSGAELSSNNMRIYLAVAILAILAACTQPQKTHEAPTVTRATLDNGLRVVIVRDPLAP